MSGKTLTPRPSQLARDAFVGRFGDIYEHSPWVAELAWDRGLGDRQDTPLGLAEAMSRELREADPERQLEVIRAHPDLAGKAAIAGTLTDDSTREQAGAGLDQCTPEEMARFEKLNAAYKKRFGFPFIMAVKGSDRHVILAAFEERLLNSLEEERGMAIEQINRIALFRLEDRADS
ncbi:2-oxo-4-hydroxy-4-carboxy-5-ureidoimidazoline decarboxylase [Microbulbifer taiwanensis]|uniref:2-oxo-4-hydroxy-4-carboxy-5-ureidoimidazoline decarboxylase n=1 Tax=Microbulbifer taiwanensis TaxID=986746 RepID=A0ABW1YJI2_9GAMM|nr:2-oxo-4-hydroxy-4-carboxy-5-ureidoimidazoline decarboxylase [Microbulbifer taiwanensis]